MRIIALILAGMLAVVAALAQDGAEPVPIDAAELAPLVRTAEAALAAEMPSDVSLSDARLALDGFVARAAGERAGRQARLDEVTARLATLAEATDADAPEIAGERQRLDEERVQLTAEIGVLDDALAEAGDVTERIVERRRELFSEALLRRQDIGRAFSSATGDAFARETAQLRGIVTGWVDTTLRQRPVDALLAGLVVLVGALAAVAGTARLGRVLAPFMPVSERPTYLARVSRAFGMVVMRTVGVAALAAFTYAVLEYFALIDGAIEGLIGAVLMALVGSQFAIALLHTALAPARPAWRLLDLDDASARELFRLATAIVLVFAFDVLFGHVATLTASPVSLVVVENFVAAVVNGLLLIAIARMRVRPLQALATPNAIASNDPPPPAKPHRGRWPGYVRVPLLVLGIGLIVAAGLGFIGLAQFAAQQIVVTGAILGTMYVGFLVARAVSLNDAVRTSAIGQAISRRRDVSAERFDQFGVLLSLVVRGGVLLVGVPLILLQWGFRAEEIGSWASTAMTGVAIGSVTISLGGILLGVAVFALGWIGTRMFQRWLDSAVMERGRVDAGVRNSVRTIVGYVCLALVGLFALSIAGVNFAGLAVVAGALSVGIGFGLQNIVSNFVSGLILLAERPFRVGDIVETGSTLGVIQRIAVRATTIETFTKQSVIVPNSDLINGVVSNWTLGNRLTRADIPVGVEYGANPRRVHELLLSIGQSHPLSLADPAPMVLFNGFGDSSLDFELRVFLANVSDKIATVNELSFQIFERLAEEGIEIPFPQRDVNVRMEGANDDLPAGFVAQLAAQAAE